MATDNPFGVASSRFMGRVAKLIRSDILRLE